MQRIFLLFTAMAFLLPLANTASARTLSEDMRPGSVSVQDADYSQRGYYRNGERWTSDGSRWNRESRWNGERRWNHEPEWRSQRDRERERYLDQRRSERRSWSAPRREAERSLYNDRRGHHGGGGHGHHGGGHHGGRGR